MPISQNNSPRNGVNAFKVTLYASVAIGLISFILAVFSVLSTNNVSKPIKNVEILLNTVNNYLPGNLRPAGEQCYEFLDFDHMSYETVPSFYCRVGNLRVFGENNIVTALSIDNLTEMLYGDLVDYYGNPRTKFSNHKSSTYIWPTCVAYSDTRSMNPLFNKVNGLYIYDA